MSGTAKLPIGIQDFGKLRGDGFLYADKTTYVYEMVQAGVPCFLSRPRRFLEARMGGGTVLPPIIVLTDL